MLTGNFSFTASTGCWKGQENWCFQSAFRTTFCRNCSWFVSRPFLLVFMNSGGGGLTIAVCRLGRDILNHLRSWCFNVIYKYMSWKIIKKNLSTIKIAVCESLFIQEKEWFLLFCFQDFVSEAGLALTMKDTTMPGLCCCCCHYLRQGLMSYHVCSSAKPPEC